MANIRIDVSVFQSIAQLHNTLKEKLQFPDYYGANADALWDCLSDYCLEESLTLEFENFSILERRLGEELEPILQVLREAERELPEFQLVLK